ncbi:hypothetical protein EMIT013CA1_50178 [Bacillus sp. IT-13CA1]
MERRKLPGVVLLNIIERMFGEVF